MSRAVQHSQQDPWAVLPSLGLAVPLEHSSVGGEQSRWGQVSHGVSLPVGTCGRLQCHSHRKITPCFFLVFDPDCAKEGKSERENPAEVFIKLVLV